MRDENELEEQTVVAGEVVQIVSPFRVGIDGGETIFVADVFVLDLVSPLRIAEKYAETGQESQKHTNDNGDKQKALCTVGIFTRKAAKLVGGVGKQVAVAAEESEQRGDDGDEDLDMLVAVGGILFMQLLLEFPKLVGGGRRGGIGHDLFLL